MKKAILLIIFFLLTNISISYSVEKPCSEHNKITQYKLYKACMNAVNGQKKNKSKFLNIDINKKYKDLRKKIAPKTGEEIWKDIKKNKK